MALRLQAQLLDPRPQPQHQVLDLRAPVYLLQLLVAHQLPQALHPKLLVLVSLGRVFQRHLDLQAQRRHRDLACQASLQLGRSALAFQL